MRKFTIVALSVLVAGSAAASENAVRVPVREAGSVSEICKGMRLAKAPEAGEVIYEAPEGEESLVVRDCDGFTTESFEEATHSQILGSLMRMVETPDGDVYLNHISSEYPLYTWVKCNRDGDKLVIKCPQTINMDYDYDTDEEFPVYIVPMKVVIDEGERGTFVIADDMDYTFDINADGSMPSSDPEILLGVCVYAESETGESAWRWVGFGDRDQKLRPASDRPVEIPSGLAIEKWVFTDEYTHTLVSVGFDGDDLYVQGMNRSIPEAWVKGHVEGDKVVFPSGQYLGPDYDVYYNSFFCGASFTYEENEDDPDGEGIRYSTMEKESVFKYDSEAKTLKSEVGYIINSTADKLFPLYSYEWVNICAQNRNPDSPPANPYDVEISEGYEGATDIWFQLPNTDIDGNLLDEGSLYYEILVNEEPLNFTLYFEDEELESTRVPYAYSDFYDIWVEGEDHTVYVYAGSDKEYRVRSVYINEKGETLYSAAVGDGNSDGVAGIAADEIESEAWYDMQGRRVVKPASGMAIRVATLKDGRIVRNKLIMK